MWLCLFVAILSTLIYINIIITELANNNRVDMLVMNDAEKAFKKAQYLAFYKLILILIMSIFWTIVICL